MKKVALICASIVCMQPLPAASAENSETYAKASYALLGKSALASAAVAITLVAGYGIWAWWNKKPAEQKGTPALAHEQTSKPEEPISKIEHVVHVPAPTEPKTVTEKVATIQQPKPTHIEQPKIEKPQPAPQSPAQPERTGPKTSTPTLAEAKKIKAAKMAAAKEMAELAMKKKRATT